MTNLKKNQIATKIKNTNYEKHKNSTCDITQTQILSKLKLKYWQNTKIKIFKKINFWPNLNSLLLRTNWYLINWENILWAVFCNLVMFWIEIPMFQCFSHGFKVCQKWCEMLQSKGLYNTHFTIEGSQPYTEDPTHTGAPFNDAGNTKLCTALQQEWFTMWSLQCNVGSVLCPVHCVHCAVYIVKGTVCRQKFAMNSV